MQKIGYVSPETGTVPNSALSSEIFSPFLRVGLITPSFGSRGFSYLIMLHNAILIGVTDCNAH